MDEATQLALLKMDLQISSAAYDKFLEQCLKEAAAYIKTEGITLLDGPGDQGLVRQYAAYLYRARLQREPSQGNQMGMPRYLRWALNNRLLEQKGGVKNG